MVSNVSPLSLSLPQDFQNAVKVKPEGNKNVSSAASLEQESHAKLLTAHPPPYPTHPYAILNTV
jgi:hypothetical protein